jgi:TonB-dependent starch-binding outer membrane protein SusC
MYAGISKLRKNIPVLNTKQYRDLMSDIGVALDPSWTDFGVWSDSVFGTGVNQNYQLALSGGNDKSKYYFSAGYLTQAGMVEPARFDRLSVRLNMDNQIKPWLKFGTNLTMNRMTTKDTPDNLSSGRGGVFMSTLNTPPFLSIWDPENPGQYDPNPFQPSWENPVAYMQGADQKATDNIFLGDVYLNFKIYEGLNFQTKFGAEVNAHQWDYYLDPFQTNYGRNNNGIGQSDKRNSTTWLWENVADYAKNWGEHHFTAMAGSSIQKYYTNDSYIYGTDFPSDVSVKTLNAANVITASTTAEEWSLVSFFARGTYDYNSKYYLTVTFREDGSSKLFNHWGFMPSFSAGWRISSENFMKDVKWIDDLKLRGGWGTNGNQEGIAPYAAYGLTEYYRQTPTNPLSGPATVTVSFGNPDLRWETTNQTNLGLDLSVLNYRLNFTFDAYYKKTSDVLLNVQLPTSYSPNTIQTNSGAITNKGLEFTINSVNVNRDVVWTTNLNMALNRNEVTDLGSYTQVYYFGHIYSNNSDVSIMKVGLPLGSFYGYVADGVNPETGDLDYKDLNGNGIFDTGDRTVIGDPNPDFIFGFTNDVTYRRWDLNLFFQGSVGNDIYNATRIDLEGMFDSKNQSTAVLNRWTPDNPYTDMPRAIGGGNTNNVRNSTRFIENGSYVRLKTITLSYKILDHNPNFKAIQQLSVYCTGENLLTFTGYSGYDPEVSAYGVSSTEAGIDYGTYPQSINVIFGLNVQF